MQQREVENIVEPVILQQNHVWVPDGIHVLVVLNTGLIYVKHI